MIHKKFALFIIILICCASFLSLATGAQADYDFTPWDFTRQVWQGAGFKTELSWPASLLKGGFIFFSKYISPVDGDRCNMYPTCAAYSREAVEKHGFIGGFLLTVDRLIHESNEIDRAPLIIKWDRLRYLDPVSNNDFWWNK